ncbi:MAG TPA: bifunctional adenosylcobinamide kinase/adenosylcobinamide-phosphate guanylyltransferase [Oscillatoriales cyanobacterium M59_W2019_021]|nr:MAG: bifunctional adenosylcobinamide kinase/adenosylcobinamide-phosphate guanylyltransferase [Cyanobacteria bacterium J055]HIK32901.1 bifunctional adenosylcobinamide kinase/adenosylcobinamide-phosphate guanylyltransferase [Oscillatoriales cyanobacterium M4454_W2019_049]HIK52016.1 bifunctional adenosylcobinamide kinase/adenosylcobinamide-phosphate guanylyltransferase [Oscillatoriales cyanobacterium M59_W2019_021]
MILVTGPARSGKSEWAEWLARQTGQPVTYIATARRDPADVEWNARIEAHRRRRPPEWKTLEVTRELGEIVRASSGCLLVDSLGTWVANELEEDDASWNSIQDAFLQSLECASGEVIVVAEETGWGVIPAYPLGRTFRDRLGMLIRRVGAIADPVYLVTGGHAVNLSALGSPLPVRD